MAWRGGSRVRREGEGEGGGTRSLFIMVVLRKAAVFDDDWARVKD
jgi:hypothetical protein